MSESFLRLKAQEQSQIYRAPGAGRAACPFARRAGKGCPGLPGAADPLRHARPTADGLQGRHLTL